MNISRIGALALGLLLWLGTINPLPALENLEILEPRDLSPGMKGYGLTVFQGTEPERFDVTILGVVPNWWAGGDMILAELDHPALKDIGVVAGMSGSPVYIDDKLIGAIAYGWGFSRRPIGGISPISKMLEVYEQITEEPNLPPTDWAANLTAWPEAREAMGMPPFGREQSLAPETLERLGLPLNEFGGMTMRPLAMPLMVSTQHDAVMREVEKLFGGGQFHPVQTGNMRGGASAAGAGAGIIGGSVMNTPQYDQVEAVNGGALSVVLVEGDLSISGVGTITLVGSDRLVAYGHAAWGLGSVDAPVATAEVTTVIPSMLFPFKIGFPVKEVGALREDRQYAIGAHLGQRSPMLPANFRVINEAEGTDRDFNFRVWNERSMLPGLVATTMIESVISSMNKYGGNMTAESNLVITLRDGRTVEKRHFHSGTGFLAVRAAMALFDDVMVLSSNRFEPAPIAAISGTIRLNEQRNLMVLDRLVRHRTRVFPGGRIEGSVQYTRWREDPVTVDFSVPVPANLKPGNYELQVVDGRTRTMLELAARPELNNIESFSDLVDRVEPSFADDRIYFVLVAPQERLLIRNNRMEDLPRTVAMITEATARDPRQTTRASGRIVSETVQKFPAQVAGSTIVPVVVQERHETSRLIPAE